MIEKNNVTTSNITISIDRKLMNKAKHIAAIRHTTLSSLMSDLLREIVESDERYAQAKRRQLDLLSKGLDLGLDDKKSWSREELYED